MSEAARAQRHTVPVSLSVPTETYREWSQAAKASGHTIDSYLIATLTIATRLKLVEGAQRLPLAGAAIDPLLAEAIRANSRGKPWEHKADLLLATPALTPTQPLPQQPDPAVVKPMHLDVGQRLMTGHGLSAQRPMRGEKYAEIAGIAYTWNQTALILAIWDHAGPDWTGRRTSDHAASAGLPARTVEPAMNVLVRQGAIEQRPHPGFVPSGPHRTSRKQRRLSPSVSAAILHGDYSSV